MKVVWSRSDLGVNMSEIFYINWTTRKGSDLISIHHENKKRERDRMSRWIEEYLPVEAKQYQPVCRDMTCCKSVVCLSTLVVLSVRVPMCQPMTSIWPWNWTKMTRWDVLSTLLVETGGMLVRSTRDQSQQYIRSTARCHYFEAAAQRPSHRLSGRAKSTAGVGCRVG